MSSQSSITSVRDNAFARTWTYWSNQSDGYYMHNLHSILKHELPFLRTLSESVPDCEGRPPRVLEVGCGTGFTSLYLAKETGAVPYVVDISAEALNLTQRTFGLEGGAVDITVRPLLGDTCKLPFPDGVFDLVFSSGLLEHFRLPSEVVAEQARVLRRGGRLFVCVPQTYTVYTLVKQGLQVVGKWPNGWESQFSAGQLVSIGENLGLKVVNRVGSGHDRISRTVVNVARRPFRQGVATLEERFGHLFMKNLIVVFERV